MLVLTREVMERIIIDDTIRITICRVDGQKVRVGIEAPREVKILREEIHPGWPGDGQEGRDA